MKHESKVANLTATMADLDTYKDKVIVFEAVRASDTTRLVTRQPLQPTNTQLLSPRKAVSDKSAGIKPSFDGAVDENGTFSPKWLPDRISQAPRSHSQTSASTVQPLTLPQFSTSNRAGGNVDMDGFAWYCANYYDRVQASYPKYNAGTYIPDSRKLLIINSWL